MMDEPAIPQCLRCGACCFGQGERYVPVTGDDHARLGDAAEEFAVFWGTRCFMRMVDGHCAALVVTHEGEFVCSIYEQRPQTCRDLARAGSACRAELEQKRESSRKSLLKVWSGS